jgi:hypothetical protein
MSLQAVKQPAVKQPIALVNMPWGAVSQASIALGILKQVARNSGFEADVHYLNVEFAARLGFELYESAQAGNPGVILCELSGLS